MRARLEKGYKMGEPARAGLGSNEGGILYIWTPKEGINKGGK